MEQMVQPATVVRRYFVAFGRLPVADASFHGREAHPSLQVTSREKGGDTGAHMGPSIPNQAYAERI